MNDTVVEVASFCKLQILRCMGSIATKTSLTCDELWPAKASSEVWTTSPKCLCSVMSTSGDGGVVSDVNPTRFLFPSALIFV